MRRRMVEDPTVVRQGSPLVGWLVDHCVLPPLAALQFLTLTPPLIRRSFSPEELGRSVGFFPLVGTLIGIVLAGLNRLLSPALSVNLSAAVLLTGWVLITGALHFDGFVDTLDGLFGGRVAASRMEVMRDERVGAFGLAGGVLLMLLKFAGLTALTDPGPALIVAASIARCGMSLSIVLFPYGRSKGLGRVMKDQAGWGDAALAMATTLAIAWLNGGHLGWAAMGLAAALTWSVALFVLARIPGLTGDVYGALGETLELAVLLFFVVVT